MFPILILIFRFIHPLHPCFVLLLSSTLQSGSSWQVVSCSLASFTGDDWQLVDTSRVATVCPLFIFIKLFLWGWPGFRLQVFELYGSSTVAVWVKFYGICMSYFYLPNKNIALLKKKDCFQRRSCVKYRDAHISTIENSVFYGKYRDAHVAALKNGVFETAM